MIPQLSFDLVVMHFRFYHSCHCKSACDISPSSIFHAFIYYSSLFVSISCRCPYLGVPKFDFDIFCTRTPVSTIHSYGIFPIPAVITASSPWMAIFDSPPYILLHCNITFNSYHSLHFRVIGCSHSMIQISSTFISK